MHQSLPEGYRWRQGSTGDRALLEKFARLVYGELFPENANFDHLSNTVVGYLSQASPIWWVEEVDLPSDDYDPVGLLWAGVAIDQATGSRHLQILLLYVHPAHRRQGIGAALIDKAEALASERGDRCIGVQTFTHNQAALKLYERLGYRPSEVQLRKDLSS